MATETTKTSETTTTKTSETTTTKTTKATDLTFTKAQLKKSKRYKEYVDVLSVVLSEDKEYTLSEAQKLIDGFLNKSPEKKEGAK